MATELADLGDGGLWLTITELAKREGVGKPTVSEKVKALETDGKIKTKPGRGRQKLVNLAQYLTAIGKAGDPARELAAETRAEDAAPDQPETAKAPGYRDAQTRKTQFEADLRELELAEKLGELVPVAEVEDAASRVSEAIARVIDRLATHAEALAVAVGKDGVPGARAKLKEIAREIRSAAAEAMAELASPAKPIDPPPAIDQAPTIAQLAEP